MKNIGCKLLIVSGITLLMAGLAFGAARPALRVKTVETRFMQEDDFKRISEYFTGVENKGWDCILRTDENERCGMYFIVNLNRSVCELAKRSQVVLQYVRSDSGKEYRKVFTLDLEGGRSREVYLGLTGEDWPLVDGHIVAWRVVIEGLQGEIIAEKQSYVWRIGE